MRIRRAFPLTLALVIVAAAVTLAVQLRKHAPPEPARLLPGADAFVYANLEWARKANGGKLLFPGSHDPVPHDPEYERFIQETSFDFERDLDAVAFAIHYPDKWAGGGTGGAASEPRFSEVFIGKFDGTKCLAYLKRTAQSVESYDSIDIFSIPLYGRSFRIAILAVDTVAASNHDDPAVIRGMVDRSRRLASPFGGPALLRRCEAICATDRCRIEAHAPSRRRQVRGRGRKACATGGVRAEWRQRVGLLRDGPVGSRGVGRECGLSS